MDFSQYDHAGRIPRRAFLVNNPIIFVSLEVKLVNYSRDQLWACWSFA